MSVGTMPLTIHVPESAPMSRRMTNAMLTDAIFSVSVFSKSRKVMLLIERPSMTQTEEDRRRTNCEAPLSALSPKRDTATEIRITSTRRGMHEIQTEGS